MVRGELLGLMDVRRPSFVRPWSTIVVNTLKVTVLTRSSSNLIRMFVSIKSRSSANMGHMGSKTSSLGHIEGKPCEHSRGHSFDPILIKLGQNVCLYKI